MGTHGDMANLSRCSRSSKFSLEGVGASDAVLCIPLVYPCTEYTCGSSPTDMLLSKRPA